MALNLEKQMVFYGQYHHDPVNVAIHMACVPVLLFTGLLLATSTPPLISLPESFSTHVSVNLGVLASLIFGSVWILMEPIAGFMLAAMAIGGSVYGTYLTSVHGSSATIYAAGIHIASWIAQFIGHGKYEGRAPALLDNLVQAIVLAPLFVWLEFLFLAGYRPELKKRLNIAVEKEVAKFRAKKEV